MMTHTYCKTLVLLLLILLLSCKETVTTDTGREISISKSEMGIESFFYEMKDDISFIQLETNDDCMVGSSPRVILHNHHVFVMDQYTKKRVLMFDDHGGFVRSFGRLGKGPGEYLHLRDFEIIDNQLVLLVSKGKAFLYYYDLVQEDPIYSTILPQKLPAYSFKVLTKDRYLFYNGGTHDINNKRYYLFIANMRDKTVEGVIDHKTDMLPSTMVSVYKNLKDDRCYFSDIEKGTISAINSAGELSGVLSISECIEQRSLKSLSDYMDYRQKGKKQFYIKEVANSQNYIYFLLNIQQMRQPTLHRYVFYNLDNHEYKVYDDKSNHGTSIDAPFFDGECFYCLASPEFAKKLFPNESFKIEDNPILLKIPIKSL